MEKKLINYKYNEPNLLKELAVYIDSTYDEHYAKGKLQATEVIISAGYGDGFTIGNTMKYLLRYGEKEGKNRIDLLKALHYNLYALYIHDLNCPPTPQLDKGN